MSIWTSAFLSTLLFCLRCGDRLRGGVGERDRVRGIRAHRTPVEDKVYKKYIK